MTFKQFESENTTAYPQSNLSISTHICGAIMDL